MDASLYGSLTFGLVGTLHCASMCGPVALVAAAGRGTETGPYPPWKTAMVYHIARAIGYLALGAFLGGAGGAIHDLAGLHVRRVLPYVLALVLVATSLDLLRRVPAPKFMDSLLKGVWARTRTASPAVRAALIGASTALLPCGLLWGIASVAATAGSALGGMATMAAFAVGSAPSLVFIQGQAAWLQRKVGERRLVWIQRGLALAVAALMVGRAILSPAEAQAGSCCHHP